MEEHHTHFTGKSTRPHNDTEGGCSVPKPAAEEAVVAPALSTGDIHRIGGGSVENLRLKPREAHLNPPGISVLKASSPSDAGRQIRDAFPDAEGLHEAAKVVGSTTTERIRSVGFDLIPNPTRKLPNHHRIIHPDGVPGFNDVNLQKLSAVFSNTLEH